MPWCRRTASATAPPRATRRSSSARLGTRAPAPAIGSATRSPTPCPSKARCCTCATHVAGSPAVLTILPFNDDSQLTAGDGWKAGGLDRLATAVKQVRAKEQPTLLLFAGDLISPSVASSVFKGAPLLAGLNLLAVGAARLGK